MSEREREREREKRGEEGKLLSGHVVCNTITLMAFLPLSFFSSSLVQLYMCSSFLSLSVSLMLCTWDAEAAAAAAVARCLRHLARGEGKGSRGGEEEEEDEEQPVRMGIERTIIIG